MAKQVQVFYRAYVNIGLHLLGWMLLGFLLLFYVPLSWNVHIPHFFWVWQCSVLAMMIVVFYVTAKFILPRTIVSEKPLIFIVWVLFCILSTQVIAYLYASNTQLHERMAQLAVKPLRSNIWFDKFVFTCILLVLALSTCWAMVAHWQQANLRQRALERDKILSELALLKMQINPHFFFNTLNSVYALTYINVEDSRKALLTLSRMMRHLLYNTEEEKTTLTKECDFLKDYVSVMALRASKKVVLEVHIPTFVDDYPIAPMLLLPFVENAFKHGVDATESGMIRIRLSQEASCIKLSVENEMFSKAAQEYPAEGGLGLANTRRRLQLLYPEKHELHTGINDSGRYEVLLTIDLSV